MTSGNRQDGAALALYRKYRSATFSEVIGQDHVTVPLRHALENGRINHAYLFSGPRGCGKTSSARILARSLNCLNGPTAEPCGVCDSCVELAPNGPGSIDVIEIDAASHGGVDDARDLRERAFFAPVRDRYKVYIIDEAHMVTAQGFNALLKLVEEPPDFLVFVFATTEPDKVLTTIRSRTHHYPFRLIPPGVLRAHLESICAAEGVVVEPAVFPLVVRSGGGSARDSLSILDQLIAGAGPEGVTYARAVALLGVTDEALLDDMVDALAANDSPAVYATVDRVVEAGHDPRRFSADLLDRFRDLILLEAVPDAATHGLVNAPQDQINRMTDQALRIGRATLTRHAEIVHTALIEMRGTTAPRLVLELLCARMLLPDAASDSAAILQRLERLERRLGAAGAAVEAAEPTPLRRPEPPPARPVAEAPPPALRVVREAPEAAPPAAPDAPPPPVATTPVAPPVVSPAAPPADAPPATPAATVVGEIDGATLRRLWPEVLDVVKAASKRTRALLETAQVASVVGDAVTLNAPAALARMINEDSNAGLVRTALTQVLGGKWSVEAKPEGSPGREPSPRGPAPSAPSAPEPAPAKAVEVDPRDDSEDVSGDARAPVVDPESQAIKLLESELGARAIDTP